jgi:hypothetical protein
VPQKLSHPQKVYLVKLLAGYMSPSRATDAFRARYPKAPRFTVQNVEHYDPTKVAGQALGKRYAEIFWRERKRVDKALDEIPIASLVYRLRRRQEIAEKAAEAGNPIVELQAIRESAEDAGGRYTNLRQVKLEDLSSLTDQELEDLAAGKG